MNVHLYPSSFTNESRMLKELESIRRLGLAERITVLAVSGRGLRESELIEPGVEVRRLALISAFIPFRILSKALSLLEYMVRAFVWVWRERATHINCHSLNVLPIGVLLKVLGRVRVLIYDAHELETERESLRGFPKRVSKWVERGLIAWVDAVIVVCEPIATWYRAAYRLSNVLVLRNLPRRRQPEAKSPELRARLGLAAEDLVFIYQGVLSTARGVSELIEVFKRGTGGRHLVLMGYGPAESLVQQAAATHRNIHFLPAVKPSEIIEYTSGADVGLFFLTGEVGLSYRYSLPNKFYEYLHAQCPVLVSDSLEYLSELVDKEQIGWSVESNVTAFAKLASELTREEILRLLPRVRAYASTNFWECDEGVLVKAFGGGR